MKNNLKLVLLTCGLLAGFAGPAGAGGTCPDCATYEASGCAAVCSGTWQRPSAKTELQERQIRQYADYCADVCAEHQHEETNR